MASKEIDSATNRQSERDVSGGTGDDCRRCGCAFAPAIGGGSPAGQFPPLRACGLLLVAWCMLLGGCGPRGPETVPVRGEITFGGGPWPKPGIVNFTPSQSAEGLPTRPGSATFDTEGNFSVTSFKPGDGLVPGHYRVGVVCWEVEPIMDAGNARSYVPERYRKGVTSGLELTVESGQDPIEVQWDVPKR